MFYSDSTHLANFGTASLWPLYLPDIVKDWYKEVYGTTPTKSVLTHLRSAGPYFEGLFQKTSLAIDRKVQDLIFVMAAWHASAKMHLHTDWSLDIFCGLTTSLTQHLCIFSTEVCPYFETKGTPKEVEASSSGKIKPSKSESTGSSHKKQVLNLDTPKIHSIVHYPNSIQCFGTTDSYSTQIGEQEHKHVKEQAIQETIEDEELPPTNPEEHHYISKTKQTPLNLFQWIKDHEKDPAIMCHPYWYFRIVKIFHALVWLNESGQEWGQWYGVDDDAKSGFAAKCCYRIGFVEGEDTFGFVNPADVLHAVHLIP
ncbi:hypothetical protein J132_03434 [Termitomyces sp. J132]|nr:hypothetical protein J132_03434 [Termitomyces sp. J132]